MLYPAELRAHMDPIMVNSPNDCNEKNCVCQQNSCHFLEPSAYITGSEFFGGDQYMRKAELYADVDEMIFAGEDNCPSER